MLTDRTSGKLKAEDLINDGGFVAAYRKQEDTGEEYVKHVVASVVVVMILKISSFYVEQGGKFVSLSGTLFDVIKDIFCAAKLQQSLDIKNVESSRVRIEGESSSSAERKRPVKQDQLRETQRREWTLRLILLPMVREVRAFAVKLTEFANEEGQLKPKDKSEDGLDEIVFLGQLFTDCFAPK
ncbi:hypothetical protein Tco_0493690 [Tanacetum coccineum]